MNFSQTITRWTWRSCLIAALVGLEIVLLIAMPHIKPSVDVSVIPFVNAQVAGNGGAENATVLYYKTTQVNGGPVVGTAPNCPYAWTPAYTSGDGYGPHYIAVLGLDTLYGGTGGTGGGWDNDPWTPVIITFPKTCFDPETLIRMADGSEKAIKNVQVGEYVVSFDEKNPQQLTKARVEEVIHFPEDQKIKITAGGRDVTTTLTHPFYVGDGQYRQVQNLRLGDTIYVLAENDQLAPLVIEKFEDAGVGEVYNLSLGGPYNFFAGGFANHNQGQGTGGSRGSGGGGGGGGGGGCFTAETPIRMADGTTRRIDEVRVGDRVLAFEESGEIVPANVTETYFHPGSEQKVTMVASGRTVITTPVHPFYIGEGQFKEVKDLRPGDVVYLLDGGARELSPVVIESLVTEHGAFDVFNLGVSGPHTFIAGDFAVHNKGGGGGGGGGPTGNPRLPGLAPTKDFALGPQAQIASNKSILKEVFSIPEAQAAAERGEDPTLFSYIYNFVAIGSDSVCSVNQKTVVPMNQYFTNSFVTNSQSDATFYSDACSTVTDTNTGVITTECNRCRICVRP